MSATIEIAGSVRLTRRSEQVTRPNLADDDDDHDHDDYDDDKTGWEGVNCFV
jgi:hypothetical protein